MNVLILEDNPLDAELSLEQLEENFEIGSWKRVDTRAGFEQALHDSEWDLILADQNLPSFDGITALEIVRATAPDIPFIFVSAHIGEEVAIDAMKHGASDYVLKHRLSRLGPVAEKAVTAARESRRLSAASQALQRTEKFALAGRLAASVAHEINNPLEAAMNLMFLVRSDRDTQRPELQDMLQLLEDQLKRVTQISQQTLGFYRNSQRPILLRLDSILQSTVDYFRARFDAGNVHLESRIEHDLFICGFPGELRQLFTNLVGNALDASKEGGTVTVIAESARRDDRSGAHVQIIDDGHGIARETIDHIFEPFFTTKGEKGTGLGLWVTHGIVRRHNGTIQVRSEVGERHGTTFSIFLPSGAESAQDPLVRTA